MTAHRTSIVSIDTATNRPASPIARDTGTLLLKKVHALRPMLAERETRKTVAAFPPIPPI
jgi:hypothetical protein